MKAVWTDKLATGNKIIDGQHKELFGYINKFFECTDDNSCEGATIKTLNYLVKYVRFHFSAEESLMKDVNYPEYKEHQTAHRQIVDTLMNCYKRLIANGDHACVIEELRMFLQAWFVEHIMGFDFKMAGYIQENAKK